MKTIFVILLMSLSPFWLYSQCDPFAGNDASACGNSTVLECTGLQSGSTVLWTSTTPNVLFEDATSATTNVMIPAFTGNTVTAMFIVTETASGGTCQDSDTILITFKKRPYAEAGETLAICGLTCQLNADTLGSGIVWATWTSSVPGVSINYTGTTPLVPKNPTIDASSVGSFFQNGQRPVSFYWIAQNALGCESVDSVLVTFYEIPNAFAGSDDTICGKNYDLIGEFSLDNPSGQWSVLSRPFPTSAVDFQPQNAPDGEVTVSDYGVYQFIWKEVNAVATMCLDRDTIQITYINVPQPDAGADQTVFGEYIELNASQTPGNQGYWLTITNNWIDPTAWPLDTVSCPTCYTSPHAVYHVTNEPQEFSIYWMESNGTCYGHDTVVVIVYPLSVENNEMSSKLSVYPNPFNNQINWAQDFKTEEIIIYNSDGKELVRQLNPSTNSLSTKDLPNGLYFVTLKNAANTYHSKIVKQ